MGDDGGPRDVCFDPGELEADDRVPVGEGPKSDARRALRTGILEGARVAASAGVLSISVSSLLER